ncbi:CPBP family intramembrane glutamic endopeptidase [Maricaulis sp.]|uniref:CPBP family intramembrane glutamic endopeptidase n=1 Tax=Maricaulis sp. TaxID=1486257 RepID=UPI003A957BBB
MSRLKPVLHLLAGLGLAVLALVITGATVRLGILPLIATVFEPSEAILSLIRRSLMLVAFIVGFWAYVRLVERRPATELTFAVKPIALWTLAGSAMIGLPLLLLYLTGAYALVAISGPNGMFGVALTILAAAMFEEIVFRGVLFALVRRHFGVWPALLIPSLIFSALHIFNDNWGGWVPLFAGLAIGIFWSLVYVRTGNIWAVGLNHAAWNYTIFVTGLPLTGQEQWRALAPLQSDLTGPDWLTGGLAGPEDSWPVVAMIIVVTGLFLADSWRRGELKRRPTD